MFGKLATKEPLREFALAIYMIFSLPFILDLAEVIIGVRITRWGPVKRCEVLEIIILHLNNYQNLQTKLLQI